MDVIFAMDKAKVFFGDGDNSAKGLWPIVVICEVLHELYKPAWLGGAFAVALDGVNALARVVKNGCHWGSFVYSERRLILAR